MNAAGIEDIYELSPLQQGMLFHTLASADPEMYLAQRNYRLNGRLDEEALAKAWQDVFARHPALRTSFHADGLDKPLQVVHAGVRAELTVLDWSGLTGEQQRKRMPQWLADDRAQGFDLTLAPLARLALIRFGDERYQFVWTHHMMLFDGWSVPLVTGEVFHRYAELTRGGYDPLPAAAPYADYIGWLQAKETTAAEQFWRDTLEGVAPSAAFARRGSRTPPDRPVSAATEVLRMPADRTAALQAMAAAHQVTLNSLVEAAWGLVVSRHGGSPEAMFGITTSGRPADLPGVESMVGLFINTLPLRLMVPGEQPIGDWLRDVQHRQAALREHEHTSLAQVHRWSGIRGGEPLFDSIVVFENYPVSAEVWQWVDDLRITMDDSAEKTSEPLTVVVSVESVLTIRLHYHRDRFYDGLVAAVAEQLRTVLDYLAVHPDGTVDDVLLISAGDYAAAARSWNDTRREYQGAGTLHALVEQHVRRSPTALAVQLAGRRLTYAELDSRAARLAAILRAAGAKPGVPVGVCGDRSLDLVVALLAVLKSGGAYLPVDPELPPERIRLMLEASGAGLVVSDRALSVDQRVISMSDWPRASAPGAADDDGPEDSAGPDDPAYVIYTSGSTGAPKGVQVSHASIRNRLLWMQDTFGLEAHDRVLQKTPFSFDVSVWEFFWPLIAGARLVLAEPGGHRDPAYLVRAIAEHGITTAHFVPSMLQLFLDEPDSGEPTALRRVFCSGEALPYDLAKRFREHMAEVELHNLYGPTEAAVDVTWWDCANLSPDGLVPIGRPVANTQIHLLDGRLRPVPVGVPAELYIGGVQVAQGYRNQPDLTSAAFVPDPFGGPGGRLYRTGDLARRLPDGTIEFLGRLDYQVKLRGFRIEPGEIEHALTRHPQIREAVVLLRTEAPAGRRLVAYLVPHGPAPSVTHLREMLGAQLPAHLVPADIVFLASMPLTANGKLDRAALPASSGTTVAADLAHDAPRTEQEYAIATVFAQVLGIGDVGAEQNLFDLGGDSFSAVRAVRHIPGATVTLLFQHPTPRGLARALGRPAQAGKPLLQLTASGPDRRRTLICVPYGGGNAVTYYPLARAMPDDVAVAAVRLPGHDLGDIETFEPLDAIARACTAEVLANTRGPIALYGHCIGVALTVEMARHLEQAGRTVDRVFLGGSFPFPRKRIFGLDLLKHLPVERWETDRRVIRYLKSLGGFEEVVEEAELAQVMLAFRHDGRCANQYFTDRYAERETARISAPITFVAGSADPETSGFQRRYREWERFAATVELAVIPDGSHYFLKHQAAELANVITASW